MSTKPTGTVTFLFTDVEGSTRLLDELGADAYAAALDGHRQVVRGAIAAHGGVEVDMQGDAFFAAFATADGALGAAEQASARLEEGLMRARMGVHTGTALATEEGYVGADVHRAARIAAAGHGGQVLVSAATAALVDTSRLRDLGEHRFKDLAAPERVYQLGDRDFPPIRSLYRTNLPVPATAFLGRRRELSEVVELLTANGARLLTLSGPGGTGKTRLALQAVAEATHRFPDGVTWVPLAPLREPTLVPATIAQALGLQEEPDRPPAESLASALAAKRALLLLDNAEHLLPGLVEELALLRSLEGLTLVVTSRERLQLQGERVYSVPPLQQDDAVALFLERAAALGVSLERSEAVAELCRRLDELPLALELAAARTPLLTAEQLLERLGQRLDLLKGGRDADPRQHTLRATITWSHELLNDEERRLFAGLSIFAGGCTFEAAEAICAADPETLQSLLDKSLVRRRDTDLGPRFLMLETIREFASEQLAAGRSHATTCVRHAVWFLSIAEEADEAGEADKAAWTAKLDAERDNLRMALDWLERTSGRDYARLASALGWFFQARLHIAEGRERLDAAVPRAQERDALRAKVLSLAAQLAGSAGDVVSAGPALREAVAIYEEVGDRRATAETLGALSWVEFQGGNVAAAREAAERAVDVAGTVGGQTLAYARTWLLQTLVAEHDIARAEPLALEELDLAVAQDDLPQQGLANHFLGDCALIRGDPPTAETYYRRSLELARRRRAWDWTLAEMHGLAMSLAGLGRPEAALRLSGAATAAEEKSGVDSSAIAFWSALKERYYGPARTALGPEASERAWQSGRSLGLEEAIEEAIGPER